MKIQHISKDPRMQAAQAKLEGLRAQLVQATETANNLRNSSYADYRATLEDEAQAILEGRPVREAPANVEADALARRCTILREAIRIQEVEVARVRNEISAEVCAKIRPEYEILAHDIVRHVKALRDAVSFEFRLRNEMDQAGLSFVSNIPVCVYPAGQPYHDFVDGVEGFLREAGAKGYE